MSNILIICDSAILCILHVVCREYHVSLIAVSEIGSPHGIVKESSRLVLIESTSIHIIELESSSELFACIYGKEGFEIVLTIGLVATRVVIEVGYWRKSIGKSEVIRLGKKEIIMLQEHKFLIIFPIYEDSVYSRSTEIACSIIFSISSLRKSGVHKEMLERIFHLHRPVSK